MSLKTDVKSSPTEKIKGKVPADRKGWFFHGLRNGIPICLGYFAVSFALGIAARSAGMNALQSFVMSVTMVASAGQFAAIGLIGASAGIIEMITTSVVVNLRYFLMSCSLTQKLSPDTRPVHRFILAYCMTDEIFGLSVTVDGYLEPFYTYGITVVSVAGWCVGTVLGVFMGDILPARVTAALSVAMYGMFLAIIIPPAKKNRFIGLIVILSMALSWIFSAAPGLSRISSGFRVIILTLLIAGIAAAVKPSDEDPSVPGEKPETAETERGSKKTEEISGEAEKSTEEKEKISGEAEKSTGEKEKISGEAENSTQETEEISGNGKIKEAH